MGDPEELKLTHPLKKKKYYKMNYKLIILLF
jgi:hypothetical protein